MDRATVWRAQNCESKKNYRGDDSKLAGRSQKLNARKEDLDGRDEAPKTL